MVIIILENVELQLVVYLIILEIELVKYLYLEQQVTTIVHYQI